MADGKKTSSAARSAAEGELMRLLEEARRGPGAGGVFLKGPISNVVDKIIEAAVVEAREAAEAMIRDHLHHHHGESG